MEKQKIQLLQAREEFQSATGLKKMRAAMTMIELGLVIVILGIILIGAFLGYQKLYLPQKADTEYKRITMVIGGIERSKILNGSVYLAANGPIDTFPIVTNAMGGATGVRDVGPWTYSCGVGNGQNLDITTTAYDSQVVIEILVANLNANAQPWTAVDNGDDTITFTHPNSTCQP